MLQVTVLYGVINGKEFQNFEAILGQDFTTGVLLCPI